MSNVKTLFTVTKDAIGFLDTFLFFTPFGGAALIIAAFTSALSGLPTISKILYSVGVAIILIPLFILAIVRIIQKIKQQTKNPETLMFPYIYKIDASQVERRYLSLNYCLPSALSYDLKFMTANCYLVINNVSTETKQLNPLTVKKRELNPDYIEIPLGVKITLTKDDFKKRMKYQLFINCWDNNQNERHLKTQEYEMILGE